jgi:hypothetical protein
MSLFRLGRFIYNSGVVYGTRRIVKYSCGNNPAEAREHSCFFDPMMTAWIPDRIPDQCYFSDLAQEYGDIFDLELVLGSQSYDGNHFNRRAGTNSSW